MKGEDKRVETIRNQLSEAKTRIAELEAKNRRQEHRITVLSDREEKFRTVVEGAENALIMVDNKGIISYWNIAAERLFGYRHGEAVGKGLGMIIPERYHAHYEKGLNVFRETGSGPAIGKTIESEAINKNGTEFPVEMLLSAIPVRGQWHAVGLVRDITDRKRIEERMRDDIQKYMIMLQNGRDAIMLIDFETHRILEVNQAAADLYGYSRASAEAGT
jgi:PAS domain S-box-containing protein